MKVTKEIELTELQEEMVAIATSQLTCIMSVTKDQVKSFKSLNAYTLYLQTNFYKLQNLLNLDYSFSISSLLKVLRSKEFNKQMIADLKLQYAYERRAILLSQAV